VKQWRGTLEAESHGLAGGAPTDAPRDAVSGPAIRRGESMATIPPTSPLTLAHWRRSVAALYAVVRATAERDPAAAAQTFRAARGRMFAEHPESPVPPSRRATWPGASWFPYDPAWRLTGTVVPEPRGAPIEIPLLADGVVRCSRVASIAFTAGAHAATLPIYWFEGYGGGLWLPFTDATNGASTYGGGRYLYDTIKGADLGDDADRIVLDFNFAYNPSCAYDERWSCPLAPPENRLPFPVAAGERLPP
jgi:uncharacterized protein (DUF1684 family)